MTLGMFLVPAVWSQLQQHRLQLSNHTKPWMQHLSILLQIAHGPYSNLPLFANLETIKDKQRLIRIGIILFFQSYNTTFTTNFDIR